MNWNNGKGLVAIVISAIIGIITIIVHVAVFTHTLQKEAIDDIRVQLARCTSDRDKYLRDYYTILESMIHRERSSNDKLSQ